MKPQNSKQDVGQFSIKCGTNIYFINYIRFSLSIINIPNFKSKFSS